jgi:hypothetical protein
VQTDLLLGILTPDTSVCYKYFLHFFHEPYRANAACLYDTKSFCISTIYRTALYVFCRYTLYSQTAKERSNIHTYIHTCLYMYIHTYILTYSLLTPWSRVLLEKLIGFAANQEIPRMEPQSSLPYSQDTKYVYIYISSEFQGKSCAN